MSRNLCKSYCCENIVRLSDLRGKPIEFRRYASYAPHIGTRWDCPTCGTAYFAWWRDMENNGADTYFVIDLSYYESFNDEHDYDYEKARKFLGLPEGTDISEVCKQWWLRCPGEDMFIKPPSEARNLCTDNAEDVQKLWGDWRDDFPRKASR